MTILLVEDSPDDVFFMKRALQIAGSNASVQVAEDGQVALDYFNGVGPFANRAEFPIPGVVLLDLRMPRVPGFEVLKWLRENADLNCIPVIILSSSREETDIQKAYRLGANSYLVKTSDTKQLGAMAKAIVDYWLVFNERPPACLESALQ
jgi:two-component system response regulator